MKTEYVITRTESAPDIGIRALGNNGPMSVRLRADETVEWTWNYDSFGRKYVSGYVINRRAAAMPNVES